MGFYIFRALFFPVALFGAILVRIIRPIVLIRFNGMGGGYMGTLAAVPEIYLLEREAGINLPDQRHLDVFFEPKNVANKQILRMWKSVLKVFPYEIIGLVAAVSRRIPGSSVHHLVDNSDAICDPYGLLDKTPARLKFTLQELQRGQKFLENSGLSKDSKFVCLIVRDDAYFKSYSPNEDWSSQDYRNCDIDNCVLACQELVKQGYFIFRMGAKSSKPFSFKHPQVIDYSMSSMRNDFNDIYLGAFCEFCLSTGTGWDTVPAIVFRRPTLFFNLVPMFELITWSDKFLLLSRRYFDLNLGRELKLKELIEREVAYQRGETISKGIRLIENTPEEIRDAVMEMTHRLKGTWVPHPDDEKLQRHFWEIFPRNAIRATNKNYHGELRARFSANYLRNNQDWLT